MEDCSRLEQRLKKLIETRIRREHLDNMKDYLTEVYKMNFGQSDKVWQNLKDQDMVSPSKGYGCLLDALQFVEEIRIKEEAEKIITEIQEKRHRGREGKVLDSRFSL